MTGYLKLPVSFPSLQRLLAPMKLLVTLTKKVLSLQLLFHFTKTRRWSAIIQSLPFPLELCFIWLFLSAGLCSQKEQRSKDSYHMPWKNTQLLAWRKRWQKVLWTGKGSKQGMAALSGRGSGQVLSPGSDICPQIIKARRSRFMYIRSFLTWKTQDLQFMLLSIQKELGIQLLPAGSCGL